MTRASSIRADRALIGDTQVNVDGVDPATIGGLYHSEWKRGSSDAALLRLKGDGAIVKESFAKKNGIELGDRFELRSASGQAVLLRAVGFYQPPRVAELLVGVIVSRHSFDSRFRAHRTSSRSSTARRPRPGWRRRLPPIPTRRA